MATICVPVDLTAFALSPACAEDKPDVARLAPITQPNYVGLQLHNSLIQHDVLDHIDFHLASPASRNPRLSDPNMNPPPLRRNRLGVYLHWSLPRLYRSAISSADGYQKRSSKDVGPDDDANPAPAFRVVPDRWLVVRRIHPNTVPQQQQGKIPEFQSWVVESSVVRNIGDIDDSADLETDCVPFVTGSGFDPAKSGDPKSPDPFQLQSEIFLGKKSPHVNYDPKKGRSPQKGWIPDPRSKAVPLTVMNSSNPLFPDYVPHNCNVFSIVDAFAYENAPGDTQYLDKATASYLVLGWHSDPKNSPLSKSGALLADRLRGLFLELGARPNAASDEIKNIQNLLASEQAFDVLCHGAVYQVKYDIAAKPPKSRADDAAKKFSKSTHIEPISLGTTPIDGVLTFLQAHDDEDQVFGKGAHDVAEDVEALASLLYAADDSYDERIRAQDLLYTNNFAQVAGGSEWHFDGKTGTDKAPATPDDSQKTTLDTLNQKQTTLDTANKKLSNLRWELFSEWWKFMSNRLNDQTSVISPAKERVRLLKTNIIALEKLTTALYSEIHIDSKLPRRLALKNQVPCKESSKAPYFKKKDPTLCIAGLDSGWSQDFMDTLAVRVDQQIAIDDSARNLARDFLGQAPNPLPSAVQNTGLMLLAEYLKRLATPPLDGSQKGHQPWQDINPFQPLFIEWEAQYYHIERKKWRVSVRKSPVGQPHSQLRYGLSDPLTASDQNDVRTVSGRVILTPQPVFSLESAVRQVIDNAGPALPFSDEERAAMKTPEYFKALRQLNFVSANLSGLTDHLLTRYEGAHVKPSFREQGKDMKGVNAAIEKCRVIDTSLPRNGPNDNPTLVELIGAESATTPYANLLRFDQYPGVPFKGVTHGQMLFTKLNIVDRFGQAICVIEPKPTPRIPLRPPPSFYPSLSDFLSPDPIADGKPLNTIYKDPEQAQPGQWPLCRFVQLTPSINQEARINASFLNPNPGANAPFWHETSDDLHENPVFGWLVLNYQDYGLQFFLQDGTFYRQVRVGGPSGTNASSKWLPFDPPAGGNGQKTPGNPQLDQLINRMTTWKPPAGSTETAASYLQGFFDMINGAIKTMPYPPSEYSAYANSIVGKPLALVNVGWSLELQAPPLKHQNTLGKEPDGNVTSALEYPEAVNLDAYNFPIKFGDIERPFDGLVGYYLHSSQVGPPNSNLPSKRKPNLTSQITTDWENLFTYFPSANTKRTRELTPQTFPSLKPYYNDPETTSSMTAARVDRYLVTTMLVDPYTPIHAYSPILPVKSLRLQPWTIQQAFARMSAFFRLGPQLLSRDVPSYDHDTAQPLKPDSWNTAATTAITTASDPANAAPSPIRLPVSGKKGMWQWLQPYDDAGRTKFVGMDVGEEDTKIRREAGPYTFVEGYLQLARPLLKADLPNL